MLFNFHLTRKDMDVNIHRRRSYLPQNGNKLMYRITDTSITVFQLHNLIKKIIKKQKRKLVNIL
jgi:hypothetical protein